MRFRDTLGPLLLAPLGAMGVYAVFSAISGESASNALVKFSVVGAASLAAGVVLVLPVLALVPKLRQPPGVDCCALGSDSRRVRWLADRPRQRWFPRILSNRGTLCGLWCGVRTDIRLCVEEKSCARRGRSNLTTTGNLACHVALEPTLSEPEGSWLNTMTRALLRLGRTYGDCTCAV